MESSSVLRKRLHDEDPYVRRDACEEICECRQTGCIPDLVELLKDDDAGVKEASLLALTSIGGREVAEQMVPLLKLDDAQLRNIGIEILEQIGPDAMDVIYRLLKDKDDDVVKFGVDIISNMREEKALKMLGPLINHSNPNVRSSVAVCLGKIKAKSAAPVLLSALNDEEEWVRFSVIEGLGLLEERAALEPLLEIIEKDSLFIKDSAIEAVSRIATRDDAPRILEKLVAFIEKGDVLPLGAVVELMEKAMLPGSDFKPSDRIKSVYFEYFSNGLEGSDQEAKEKALKGLALLRLPDGVGKVLAYANSLKEINEETEAFLVGIIVAIAGRGPLPRVLTEELARRTKTFRVVIRALGEMKSTESLPILESLVGSAANHELREIVSAIEEIGSPESAGVLYQCIRNADGHTRKISARALARLVGPGAVDALFDALKAERYRDVMEEITDVLAVIPSESVNRGFCGLLSSDEDHIREMAARGLGQIGDESSVTLLEDAAADGFPNVRQAAYKSLAMLGVPEALDVVLRGLKDDDDDVKLSVLKALSGWTGEMIKEALFEALEDGNLWVRYNALLLLGDVGGSGVEEKAIGMILKDEAPVKAAAAKTLEKAGTSKAIEVLEKYIDHPDPTVRIAVENALESLSC